MIAEPVLGAGGAIMPPRGLFRGHRRGAVASTASPLIDDEVICGFGRTGKWFGCQTYGFHARYHVDRQGAVVRLSADLRGADVARDLATWSIAEAGKIGTFGHGFTYSGHPVAARWR